MINSIKQDNIEIKMDVETDVEQMRLRTLFTKEPETISWMKELIKPGEVFYDVGANVGVYSLFAAAFHKNKVKILSFEPAYHNFNKLCINILANNFSGIITPYCLGIGEHSVFDALNLRDATSGSAGHRIGSTIYQSGLGGSHKAGESFSPALKQGIYSAAIDDLVNNYKLPAPQHIKIDIDGGEEKVLLGASKTLSAGAVLSVLIELDDKDGSLEKMVRQLMEKHGFNADHPINFQENHSRARRAKEGNAHIKNIIFTKN